LQSIEVAMELID